MGWSGRVPAPRASKAGEWVHFKEHAHVQQKNRSDRRDRPSISARTRFILLASTSGARSFCGAHHLSRKLNRLGHDARLMPAKYVRAYSKGQKNDFRDAEAIAEAV